MRFLRALRDVATGLGAIAVLLAFAALTLFAVGAAAGLLWVGFKWVAR